MNELVAVIDAQIAEMNRTIGKQWAIWEISEWLQSNQNYTSGDLSKKLASMIYEDITE